MKNIRLISLLFFLVIFQSHAYSETLFGRVVGVSDGDTITLLDTTQTQHKIRLTGIDAPEKAQAFGQISKKTLSNLIYNKEVQISWQKRDRYHRILGKVLLNGQDICLEQVKRGMAWHYKKYQRDQSLDDQKLYSDAEANARASRLGLWTEANPIEPSVFRHKK